MNGVMYQMDENGNLYEVDPKSGKTLGTGGAQLDGVVMDDLEMAHWVNNQSGENYIYGIYGSYIL